MQAIPWHLLELGILGLGKLIQTSSEGQSELEEYGIVSNWGLTTACKLTEQLQRQVGNWTTRDRHN